MKISTSLFGTHFRNMCIMWLAYPVGFSHYLSQLILLKFWKVCSHAKCFQNLLGNMPI